MLYPESSLVYTLPLQNVVFFFFLSFHLPCNYLLKAKYDV